MASGAVSPSFKYMKLLTSRATTNSGTYSLVDESLAKIRLISTNLNYDVFTKASFIVTPSGLYTSKLLATFPTTGDMTFTRSTTATYISSTGSVVSSAINTPRIDYTYGRGAFLIEGQRQNLWLNSAVGVTQTITATPAVKIISFWGTGTIATPYGNFTGTSNNVRSEFVFTPTVGTNTYTVTGNCLNVQLENGAFSSSYIPTTTTSLTRGVETASLTSVSSLIGQTEGTLYIEYYHRNNATAMRALTINDGTTNNYIAISPQINNKTRFALILSGLQIFGIDSSIAPTTGWHKFAARYKSGDINFYIDGVSVGTSALTFTTPLSMSRIDLGNAVGSSQLYSGISCAMIFPTALTDVELQKITT